MAEYIVDTEKVPSVLRDLVKHESGSLQEVVRCRDCKFYYQLDRLCNKNSGILISVTPDSYCNYGERR